MSNAARTSLTDMRLNDLELRSNTLIANNSPHHRHILPTRSRGSRFFARLRGAQCATLIRRPLRRHFSAMVRMSFSAKPLPHRTLPRRRPPVRSNGEPQRNLAHHVTHGPASPTPDRSSRPPKLTSTFRVGLTQIAGRTPPKIIAREHDRWGPLHPSRKSQESHERTTSDEVRHFPRIWNSGLAGV